MKYIKIILAFSLFAACGRPNDGLPLFIKKEVRPNALTYNKNLSDYTMIEVSESILNTLLDFQNDEISIKIPYKDEELNLDLHKVNIFDDSFVVNTGEGLTPYNKGVHYTGKIRNRNGSFVSINLFKDNVSGIISDPELGDLNIGKSGMGIKSEYIIYNPEDAKDTIHFDCASPDGGYSNNELEQIKAIQRMTKENVSAATNSCVTVDFELTQECFLKFGTVQLTVDWFTALFSGVKALYKNEGIDISIKSVYVWTTDDKYSDNPNEALNQLKTKRLNDLAFKGNFVHLVRAQTNNLSGLAWVGSLCVNSYRFGYSAVLANYASYPAFSWSTMVLTHELGHNLGSQHTQWCGWVGGALDNCYTTEGGCAPGPAPTNGGTIMSYCHLSSYGVKFSNGFGKQPGDKIRSIYNSSSCAACVTNNEPPLIVDPIISIDKYATQSTNYNSVNSYPALKAFDGRQQPEHLANFSHTGREDFPWLQVDLGSRFKVSKIRIINRYDCCSNRIQKMKVFVFDNVPQSYNDTSQVYLFNNTNPFSTLDIPVSKNGRYVRVWLDQSAMPLSSKVLHLSEVYVHGIPAVDTCVWRDTIYKIVRDSIGKVCR